MYSSFNTHESRTHPAHVQSADISDVDAVLEECPGPSSDTLGAPENQSDTGQLTTQLSIS